MKMLQYTLLKCYNFNALVVFLTLILFDRFRTVLNIVVSPAYAIDRSQSDYGYNIGEVHTKQNRAKQSSEILDWASIDESGLVNGFSHEFNEIPEVIDSEQFNRQASFVLNEPRYVRKMKGNGDEQSDFLGQFLKKFSIYHTLFEMPSFLNSRVAITSRIVPKPLVYQKKIIRPVSSPLGSLADGFKDKLKAIYPGTLWCGDGNQAKYLNEVGLFRNTDICCKQHDQCASFIPSGSQYKGLRNTGLFTRSHCDCDHKFYNCLKKTDSLVSNKIGYTYFNILRPQCFRKEYPIVGCKEWSGKKCYVYSVDNEKLPSWQWFDNKLF